MTETTLNKLHMGDLFTLVQTDEPNENNLWVRSEYDRSSKTYICYKWCDVNHFRNIKGTRKVYTD